MSEPASHYGSERWDCDACESEVFVKQHIALMYIEQGHSLVYRFCNDDCLTLWVGVED